MSEDAIKEASWAAQFTVGLSTYFYGTGYSHEQFEQDLDKMIKHMKESA